MTSPDPYYRPARLDVARDVAAVLLMVAMVVGLTWVGFETDWRLGVTVLSLTSGGVGVALGLAR